MGARKDRVSKIISVTSLSLKGFRMKRSTLPSNDAAALSSLFALVTITGKLGLRRLASSRTSRLLAPGRVMSRRSTSIWSTMCANQIQGGSSVACLEDGKAFLPEHL